MAKIEQKVLEVLSSVEIDEGKVRITKNLDRKTYLAVNKVLDRVGGKWNRKAKVHVFDVDPTSRLNAVIEHGILDPKVKTGYFPTPPKIIERMIELAELEHGQFILEPSAGQGHIADEICKEMKIKPEDMMVCEILSENNVFLEEKGYINEGDFFEFAEKCKELDIQFDRILMNPPFELQKDLLHVTAAYELLKENGILVSVMSSGVTFRKNKKTQIFHEKILDNAELIEENPEGSFKSSGTMVNTILVKLVK